MDARFEQKMREWVVGVIENSRSFDEWDTHVEDVEIASALGVNMSVTGPPSRQTLLHRAAQFSELDMLHALIRDGTVNVDARDARGSSPLFLAACSGHVEAARALLHAGADPSLRDNCGFTPLHGGAWDGSPELVALLLDAGVDVNVTNNFGQTPLHEASARRNAQVIRILMRAGANANARNNHGETPYDKARDEECRESLLEQ